MPLKPTPQMFRIHQQNRQLQNGINQYLQQIQHLKTTNDQHQTQIESLLKFNQRLLTIIQEEVNNNQSRNYQRSLQPITQVSEIDSETMENMMQSLQKTRTKLAARSQRGGELYRSIMQLKSSFMQIKVGNTNTNNVYEYMNQTQDKDMQRSQRFGPAIERQMSQFGNMSSFSKKKQKKMNLHQKASFDFRNQKIDQELSIEQQHRVSTETKPLFLKHVFGHPQQQKRTKEKEYNKIEDDLMSKMNQQLREMRKNSQINRHFFEQKTNQLDHLSKEVIYNPEQKFNELQGKIKLPPHLAAMVKKAMVKRN